MRTILIVSGLVLFSLGALMFTTHAFAGKCRDRTTGELDYACAGMTKKHSVKMTYIKNGKSYSKTTGSYSRFLWTRNQREKFENARKNSIILQRFSPRFRASSKDPLRTRQVTKSEQVRKKWMERQRRLRRLKKQLEKYGDIANATDTHPSRFVF